MDGQNLIKNTNNMSKEETNLLREKFLSEYSKNKGWDKNNLTPEQMLEITQQSGFKTPWLLLG